MAKCDANEILIYIILSRVFLEFFIDVIYEKVYIFIFIIVILFSCIFIFTFCIFVIFSEIIRDKNKGFID